MKVLLINGSPNKNGCTYTAMNEISLTLNFEGIETEIYHIGKDPIAPCRACRACGKLGHCVINDKVNEFVEYARNFDGYAIGSPVHYGSAFGAIVPFLDRAFFVDFMSGHNSFIHKPGTAIVSARRAGTTATLDQLNKYFQINQMPVISGRYWNMVHGANPDEVKQDLEGMQNMRILAKNMAYHLKCKEAAQKAGINPPSSEEVMFTNFIR
ncbi:MAG: flavodoxin family protein [Candidatus Gastranaerophilales bacterium]|nr:flavodoxin family protein [Candidatus Gastranaerophilales bacterium]